MSTLPESARALIESPALGHVVTLNTDGSPQVSCVWVGWDDGRIVFASLSPWQKIRNLERDPRIAVSVESSQIDPSGLRQYLAVRGKANVTEGGALDWVRRLARVYMGPDVVYPPEGETRGGYVVHVEAEKITGIGPWSGPPPEPIHEEEQVARRS